MCRGIRQLISEAPRSQFDDVVSASIVVDGEEMQFIVLLRTIKTKEQVERGDNRKMKEVEEGFGGKSCRIGVNTCVGGVGYVGRYAKDELGWSELSICRKISLDVSLQVFEDTSVRSVQLNAMLRTRYGAHRSCNPQEASRVMLVLKC